MQSEQRKHSIGSDFKFMMDPKFHDLIFWIFSICWLWTWPITNFNVVVSVSIILKCTYETPLSPVALLTRSPSPILIIIFSRTSMPSSISVSGTEAPNKVETVRNIQKSCNQIIVFLLRWLDAYWRRKPGVGLNFRTFIKNWGKQRVRVHRSLYLAHLCHKVMPTKSIFM